MAKSNTAVDPDRETIMSSSKLRENCLNTNTTSKIPKTPRAKTESLLILIQCTENEYRETMMNRNKTC